MSDSVWLDGTLLPAATARIDPADRGFTLGDGLFETVRAQDGQPRWVDRHLARLRAGADVLGIPLAWTNSHLVAAMHAVLAGRAEAVLRLTLTRGPAARGVLPPAHAAPTLLVTAGPRPAPAPAARLVTARTTRRNERSPLARIKSLNYLDSIIARAEAAERGADDAILLDTRGRIAESTVANLLVVLGGGVFTPPIDDGALPGIARGLLLEAGLATERTLWPDDLAVAEAACLVNCLGARPVASLDGRPLDAAHPALAPVRQALS